MKDNNRSINKKTIENICFNRIFNLSVRVYHNISEIVDLKNTIVTIGTFDGVHLGHQKIIRKLVELKKQHGGETLLFTFDPHPRKILFPEQHDLKLITTTQEKCDLLKQFGIDNVLIFPFDLAFSKMSAEDYVSEIIAKKLNTKIIDRKSVV